MRRKDAAGFAADCCPCPQAIYQNCREQFGLTGEQQQLLRANDEAAFGHRRSSKEWSMQRLGSRQGQPRMSTFPGKATAAVIFTAALCQSGVATAGAHGGGGAGLVAGSMGADLEGSTAAVFMGAGFTPAVSMAVVFAATGSMTVDLEAFAVDLACWDGPTTRIHTDRIIIRTTVKIANTVTHILGITAPIPPVITLM
jgi:hypothetical protein